MARLKLGDQVMRAAAFTIAWHPVHVAQRQVDNPMAEQALQPVHRQPGLELMCRVGLAKGMDAADLGDAGARPPGPGAIAAP